jgi:hypothetical protein
MGILQQDHQPRLHTTHFIHNTKLVHIDQLKIIDQIPVSHQRPAPRSHTALSCLPPQPPPVKVSEGVTARWKTPDDLDVYHRKRSVGKRMKY